jgi:hypothetical protein
LNLGEVPTQIVLDEPNGGTSEGKAWHSESLLGKVHILIYMDPDKREESKLLLDALTQRNDKRSEYSTVAIINLAATWMPNSILESKIKRKQKELKNIEYIFDKKKFLIKKWHLKDDAANVFILNKQSKVIYAKSGKLNADDVSEILDLLNETK